MVRNKLLLIAGLFLVSCSDDNEPSTGYTTVGMVPDVYEICNHGECGNYPELSRCENEYIPKDIRCVFIPNDGCHWVIFQCR